jgi:hypothetical protein
VAALRASAAASEARVSELTASSAGREGRVAELLQQLQGRMDAEEASHTLEMQGLSERMLELQEANTALLHSRVFEPAQAAIDTYTARVAGLLTRFGEVTDAASAVASRLGGLRGVRDGDGAGAAAQPPATEGAAATPVEAVPAWLAAALTQLQQGVSAASSDAAVCAPLLTQLRDLHAACVHALVAACRHRSVSRDILSALPLQLRTEVQAARGAASATALEASAATALARGGSASTLAGGRESAVAPRARRSSGAHKSARGSEAAPDTSTAGGGPAPPSASFLASRRGSMGSQISRASSFLTHSNATTGTALGHLPYGPDSGELVALTLSHIQAALAEGLGGDTSAATVRHGSRAAGVATGLGAADVPRAPAASKSGLTRAIAAAVPLSAALEAPSTTSRARKGAAGYSQQYQRQREQGAGVGPGPLPGQPSMGGDAGPPPSASPPRPADDTPSGARSRPAIPRTLHY